MDQEKYETAAPAMVGAAQRARANHDDLVTRLGRVFARREMRLQAGKYLAGLASEVTRKNGWTLAEHAGDLTPDKMQRLLNHAVWDEQQAMDVVREFVMEHLGDPDPQALPAGGRIQTLDREPHDLAHDGDGVPHRPVEQLLAPVRRPDPDVLGDPASRCA